MLPLSPRQAASLSLLVAGFAPACKQRPAPSPAASGAALPPKTAPVASHAPSARRPKSPPRAGERVAIPGGTWYAGSLPGDPGRLPELEPTRFQLELGPFRIDRLPYPNDPDLPPLTSVTRDEARRACAERGARLCTELEWERACRGPSNEEYAAGIWDERCAREPSSCESGFGVLGMGGALREWTMSDVLSSAPVQAALRGAGSGSAAADHRCATRRPFDPSARAADLGFRCCSGAPNAALAPEPKLGEAFEKTRMPASRLTKLLAESERTAWLAKDVVYFREPESAETVVTRGPGDRKGQSFTVAPLLWNPSPGSRILLVSARSGEARSFVVAYHVLGDDAYRLAASFVMEGERGPVAFAYDPEVRPRVHFSTCWGCLGETGKIVFRKPERVAILQP